MPSSDTMWKAGQSGNPSGRPKRKPVTDALLRELSATVRGGGTNAEKAAEHLVKLMFHRNPRTSLEASKLVLSYVEGMPVQTVELDVYDVARQMAEARGLDPEKVISIFHDLKARRTA